MAIQVGDVVEDYNGELVTVLAVAGDEAALLHPDAGIVARFLRDLRPHVPPAPEPPLTGEQMAYVLETLAKEWAKPHFTSETLLAAAKEFRK